MTSELVRKKILLIWGNWGPYHYARYCGFKNACLENQFQPLGLELFQKSNIYEWKINENENLITHFSFGDREMDFPVWKCLTQLIPHLWRIKADVVFVPSYWHWSLLTNLVCRIRGAKIIMMNESHADTERARGFKRWIKKQIVRRFHAGFVGGKPHARHFSALGLLKESIFTGYDAIDVDYYATKAVDIRANKEAFRKKLNLPNIYFLSLSRMVEKKNLHRLVDAYCSLKLDSSKSVNHLVFVGSGPLENSIRNRVKSNGVRIYLHQDDGDNSEIINQSEKGVHFYGFRQIDENPIFFTLSTAFVMPSEWEEWGLVVNEALACSTPVVVAENAGCAEDLVIDNVTGFKINPLDTESISDGLLKLVTGETDAEAMGRRGLDLVKNFDCRAFGDNAIKAVRYVQSRP